MHTQITGFPFPAFQILLAFLILTVFLSFTKGRLFCNTVCHIGTFLGLISKISLFRIKFDDAKCTKCGRCAVVFKSNCVDFLNKDIDYSRCVDCFNCLKSCRDKAPAYGWLRLKKILLLILIIIMRMSISIREMSFSERCFFFLD